MCSINRQSLFEWLLYSTIWLLVTECNYKNKTNSISTVVVVGRQPKATISFIIGIFDGGRTTLTTELVTWITFVVDLRPMTLYGEIIEFFSLF